PAAPVAASCTWSDAGTGNANLKDVGKPSATAPPNTGTEKMTITTNLGTVTATVDLAKSPCTAASFAYLAGKNFFSNTRCHRLSTTWNALQCGDPTGTGQGGPKYTYANEYVPTTPAPPPSVRLHVHEALTARKHSIRSPALHPGRYAHRESDQRPPARRGASPPRTGDGRAGSRCEPAPPAHHDHRLGRRCGCGAVPGAR